MQFYTDTEGKNKSAGLARGQIEAKWAHCGSQDEGWDLLTCQAWGEERRRVAEELNTVDSGDRYPLREAALALDANNAGQSGKKKRKQSKMGLTVTSRQDCYP